MDLLLFFLVQSLPVISSNPLLRKAKRPHQPQATMLATAMQTRMFRNPPTRMLDKREKDKDKENTKMFKHITAITCVIKPLVDCFLNNPSPVIYIDASFCSNYGKLLSAMFMDANHHIQPIACHFCGEETGVDYTLLLTALMEAGLNEREYLVFNSDGSAAINMI